VSVPDAFRAPAARPLAALLDGLTATGIGALDWRGAAVSGVSLDSRQLEPGELYLALPGTGSHGLDHVRAALDAGAAAVAGLPGAFAAHADAVRSLAAAGIPAVEIEGLEAAVPLLGGRCFGAPDETLRLVAVTGTDGKTSVCRFVAEAFALLGEPAGYIGTLGWGLAGGGDGALQETALTTPDALVLRRMLRRLLDGGARTVALEASSHGLAQGRLDGLSIDMAVLTNLGRDHLDYHGDETAYAEAKASLFDRPGLAARIVNADDRLGRALVTRGSGSITTFSLAGPPPDTASDAPSGTSPSLSATRVRTTLDGLRFVFEEHAEDGTVERADVVSRLYGRFNVQNLLACAGVLRRAGIPFERVVSALSRLEPVAGRMQRVTAGRAGAPTVIVDFAHTPGALGAAVAAVRAHCPGRLCVVFGCGGDRDPGKRAPMARAAAAADRAIVTDDNPRTEASGTIIDMILAGFPAGAAVRAVPDRATAIALALHGAGAGDVVLIAGKGHERYQLVGDRRLPFSDVEIATRALRHGADPVPLRTGAPCA